MIKASTEIIHSIKDETEMQVRVLFEVPKQLKPVAKIVLTHELAEILNSMDKFDPDIIVDAMRLLIEEIQNEQN